MNNPIIPKLETQQKYPLFYAEATKTINDIIEHITKERGVYSSNIEPDPKEHNIWFNTNDNKIYRWVEEEQSWKIISGSGSSEIVYFTESKGDFYNSKIYIFDGNKYDSDISKISPIEPITNFEAILINCDFINSDNNNHDINLDFKYINGDTNTNKGIYYVKYIDGYCIVTKLTNNTVIYGKDIEGAQLMDVGGPDLVEDGVRVGRDYIEIKNDVIDDIGIGTVGISVTSASMLEIPKDITFCPYDEFYIDTLILYGDVNFNHFEQYLDKFDGDISKMIIYNGNNGINTPPNIHIYNAICDYSIRFNAINVQTNNHLNPPFGDINNMILCNTGDYVEINNEYNVETGGPFIPVYVLYGKFNIEYTINSQVNDFNIVFTEIPKYIKIRDYSDGAPITLFIFCKPEHKEQIEELITDAKLAENIYVLYRLIDVNHIGDEINIVDDNEDIDITIYKNYIK